jgi:dihydrofolate reductase
MRRIVTFNWMSVDGLFSGPDGDLSWVVPDDEQRRRAATDISRFDTAIFGRKTYQLFSEFWTKALDDPTTAPDPHRPGQRTPEHRVVAVALNAMMKVVFSTELARPAWSNTRVLRQFDASELAAMKRQEGKDLIVFGSGSIASQLAAHDLIDEYQFVVCPIALGQGRQLVSGLTRPVHLELVEEQRYSSGDLMLRYVRRKRITDD